MGHQTLRLRQAWLAVYSVHKCCSLLCRLIHKTRAKELFTAVMILATTLTFAEQAIQVDATRSEILVTGLNEFERRALIADVNRISLQLEENRDSGSMLLSADSSDERLIITPMFELLTGQPYVLSFDFGDGDLFETSIQLNAQTPSTPALISFSPNAENIPANTLRFYLTFSEPMARGQVANVIRLEYDNGNAQGTIVLSPFLNLDAELWGPEQKRLTLLLDPGRIKQGVGPNVDGGAPLQTGMNYRLVVSGEMISAHGVAIGDDQEAFFSVGEAQRQAINPDLWKVDFPSANTVNPLTIGFDRLMDSGASLRLIHVIDAKQNQVVGTATTDGMLWTFTPQNAWEDTPYFLSIAPDLEDVSGNTIESAFDASAGTMGTQQAAILLEVNLISP